MNTLVVICHPLDGSFTRVCAERVIAGETVSGRAVEVIDLYGEGFLPELTAAERAVHHAGLDAKPLIADHAAKLKSANRLVLVYPTWWGAQPAMLKGWFDRVWTTGVAYELPEGKSQIRGLLRNITSITAVTTHGPSKLVNVLEGEPGKRMLSRQIRPLCSWRCRFRWVPLYGIDKASLADREAFLARVDKVFNR